MSDLITTAFFPTMCGLVWRDGTFTEVLPETTTRATPERVVAAVLRRALNMLEGAYGALFLTDTRSAAYRLVAIAHRGNAAGGAVAPLARVPGCLGSTPHRDVVILPDDDRSDETARAFVAARTSVLFVALRLLDDVVGALAIERTATAAFVASDRRVALTVAQYSALAVNAVRLA